MPARFLAVALGAIAFGCGGGGGSPAAVPDPVVGLEIVDGDDQVGPVETTLSEFLLVRAVDAAGRPVADVPVFWLVVEGDGELSVKRPRTDAAGLASALLFLGEVPGEARVRARIQSGAEVVFSARATAAEGETGP